MTAITGRRVTNYRSSLQYWQGLACIALKRKLHERNPISQGFSCGLSSQKVDEWDKLFAAVAVS